MGAIVPLIKAAGKNRYTLMMTEHFAKQCEVGLVLIAKAAQRRLFLMNVSPILECYTRFFQIVAYH